MNNWVRVVFRQRVSALRFTEQIHIPSQDFFPCGHSDETTAVHSVNEYIVEVGLLLRLPSLFLSLLGQLPPVLGLIERLNSIIA